MSSPQQPSAKARRSARRSVYIIDRIANVSIRVGGLGVVLAVLGLVAFIISQVLPLFGGSSSGEVTLKAPAAAVRTLYLGCDEYRRLGVRVLETGRIELLCLPTGEVLQTTDVPNLGDARLTCCDVGVNPYTTGIVEGIQNVPRHAMVLGTSDGRVLFADLLYLTAFKLFELGKEPPDLKALTAPTEEQFKAPEYIPQAIRHESDGSLWVTERLPDFGSYRLVGARILFEEAVIESPFAGAPLATVSYAITEGETSDRDTLLAATTADGRAWARRDALSVNMMTDAIERSVTWEAELGALKSASGTPLLDEKPRFVLAHPSRQELLVASESGLLHHLQREKEGDGFTLAYPPQNAFAYDVATGREWVQMLADAGGTATAGSAPRLTALAYLLGGSSVLVGDSLGGIQSFMPVRAHPEDINPRLTRVRIHDPAPAAVRGFETAAATKAFLAWDDAGGLRAVHNTSQRVYFSAQSGKAAPQLAHLGPKNNGVLAVGADGALQQWWMEAGHIEISLRTLFGKVHYEGHDAPKYEWQSHAGTDDVEVKMSLVPLVMGTVKGGLYALLFALPLALLGAIYTSEFMHPRLRGVVKPAMEIMAALPSVVLGFLGALYFAPLASPILPSLLLAVVLGPLSFMLFGWIFGQLPPSVTSHFGPTRTIAVLISVAVVAVLLALNLGPYAESWLFPAAEGANPAMVDPVTFAPANDAAAAALRGGSFQAWTDGGRELARETATAGASLPKDWWIPGGHSLFLCLMALPCALLAGWLLTRLHRAVAPRLGGGCPVQKLRLALGGGGTGLRSVAANIALSLAFWVVAAGLGFGLAALVAPATESILFGYDHPTAGHVADFRRFLTGSEGWKFSKTNSLIVGFSMGFAVIPIIYSIAEDSLSSVPNQLRAASLACGASRWQTAMRVVVPSAASGIFSAIVIGLGRALGETMIVVMAAGGTPVTDLQPLSGFRSLAAAIAIEMPEAPHGSSHYRVLFLAGLMLFAMTFVISTLSELVRMRLRKKMNRM